MTGRAVTGRGVTGRGVPGRGVPGWVLVIGCVVAAAAIGAVVALELRRQQDALEVRLLTVAELARPEAWVAYGGAWSPGGTETQNNSQERGAKLIAKSAGGRNGHWGDYQIEADVTIAEPYGGAGVVIRTGGEEEGVDAYHGYYAGIRTMDATFEFGRADFGWHSLLHRSLPEGADLTLLMQPMHLRVVAVGCRFAMEVVLADGSRADAGTEDPDCLKNGGLGLRSYLTSATWKNVRVSRAGIEDVARIEDDGRRFGGTEIGVAEPYGSDAGAATLKTLRATVQAEAEKHQLRPGVEPISKFLMLPGRHPNVIIQGMVISTPPLADIQDDTGALVVPELEPGTVVKVGDEVEAVGTVVSDRFRSELDNAKITVLWSDTEMIPPLSVTAAQLTSGTYRGRSIEVEGILRGVKVTPEGGYDLALEDAGQMFRSLGAKDFRFDPAGLQVGSRLRLRGMATSLAQFTDGMYSFAVITNRVETISPPPWWSARHIAWVVGACVSLLLAAQFLLHRLQRWRLRSVLKEREQLAFEMHDTLAQSFTGIAYQLQAASTERRGEAMMKTHVESALEMVKVSHREASRTIAALRPQYRDAAGILRALQESANRLSDGGDLKIVTALQGRAGDLPLEVTDALFRIGQEAISNAIQHSGCRVLAISLGLGRREARLEICDDGRGFDAAAESHGLGLGSMRTRAAKIRSRFELKTVPGEGTSVVVNAPLHATRGWLYGLRARMLGLAVG